MWWLVSGSSPAGGPLRCAVLRCASLGDTAAKLAQAGSSWHGGTPTHLSQGGCLPQAAVQALEPLEHSADLKLRGVRSTRQHDNSHPARVMGVSGWEASGHPSPLPLLPQRSLKLTQASCRCPLLATRLHCRDGRPSATGSGAVKQAGGQQGLAAAPGCWEESGWRRLCVCPPAAG